MFEIRKSAFQILSGRNDRNVSKRIENKKIFIAGHDEVRSAVDGEFEKHVIFRIAAGLNGVDDGNHFSHRQQ